MKKKLLVASLFCGFISQAQAAPACDDRVAINNPARFPFNTIATIRYDNTCSGNYKAWGTGSLVGPHMLLTAGHVVYNRSKGKVNQTCNYIQPGAYHDSATGAIVHPYGERTISDTKYKRTNNKWADSSYSPERGVDYGAIRLVCPFEDINTYMPMVFDLSPTFINTSGYPIKDLPSTGNIGDQWRGAGSVTAQANRTITYDQRSTSGASGSPVWIYNAGAATRRITAVNTAHSTQCNGIGTRLVWQNEGLINKWLDWEPTAAEELAEGCVASASLLPIGIGDLVNYFQAGKFEPFTKTELNLVPVPVNPEGQPRYRVYQFIQNQKFVWEEFLDSQQKRYLKLLQPQQKWLSIEEAQALLSASESWVDQEPSGLYEQRVPVGQTWNGEAYQLPLDPVDQNSNPNPDKTADFDFQ
ncbi:trypsin-like serine peptidase [Microbulbifer sp. 2201CG32-9]|uniref:trypsin-like serine peptidase n=1 Tax=Microbulbifer sp. 2201CG32-9 TaxID=3232309 RepID=UPI00345C0329